MPATYYPAVIDRSASGFGVTFPDFLGCVASGATINEACLQAEQALALHVEAMVKDKDVIPVPSDLDAIEPVDGADDVARVMVRADVPAKVERVLVSIDANLLRAIDAAAPNRSAFFADAARAHLGGVVAAGIVGQGELATRGWGDLEARYGLKPKHKPEAPSLPRKDDKSVLVKSLADASVATFDELRRVAVSDAGGLRKRPLSKKA